MAVLIHERPEGEIVVSECDWLEGVQSFNRIIEEHYGDSWQSVWEISERQDEGTHSAIGVAGDVVVLSAHGLEIGREGIKVVPNDGMPWLLVRRKRKPSE